MFAIDTYLIFTAAASILLFILEVRSEHRPSTHKEAHRSGHNPLNKAA